MRFCVRKNSKLSKSEGKVIVALRGEVEFITHWLIWWALEPDDLRSS